MNVQMANSKSQTVGIKINITEIDISRAFDTAIARSKLLEILNTFLDLILNEDEMRIIRLLLTNTTMQLRTNNDVKIFISNIGSPQGDSISGVLFNIYFEASLRKVCEKIDARSIILSFIVHSGRT